MRFLSIVLTTLISCATLYEKASCENQRLIFAFSEFGPFKFMKDNHPNGLDVQLLREIARKLNMRMEFVECSFARCMEFLKTGEADVVTSLQRRPDREEYIRFIEPPYLTKSAKRFYVRKGYGWRIKKHEDLYGMRIGVKRGVAYFPRFDSDSKILKEAVNDAFLNLKKLEKGRIDAFINTESEGDFLIKKGGFEGAFEKAPYTFNEKCDVYIGLSKKSKLMPQIREIETITAKVVTADLIRDLERKAFEAVPTKK
ncbi:MAG TPA: transporter substrate-binding domain-containing protein [Bacteroidales bacterium]|nr:transporter substrate-binding domain-containing protein [Bacteroidales bacterium]